MLEPPIQAPRPSAKVSADVDYRLSEHEPEMNLRKRKKKEKRKKVHGLDLPILRLIPKAFSGMNQRHIIDELYISLFQLHCQLMFHCSKM